MRDYRSAQGIEALSEAQKRLVAENYNLVGIVARKKARSMPSFIALDDLISYGTNGLIDAARKYDPSRNAKFSTFANVKIDFAILDGLQNRDNLTMFSDSRVDSIDIPEEPIVLASDSRLDTEYIASQVIIRESVRKEIFKLPGCEQEVMILWALRGLKQNEISKIMHISSARVYQLLQRAIEKLRPKLKELSDFSCL